MAQPDPPEIPTLTWKGQKRYCCTRLWESGDPCAYNHYDLQTVIDHIASPHTRSGKPAKLKAIVEEVHPPRPAFAPPQTPADYVTTAKFKTEK